MVNCFQAENVALTGMTVKLFQGERTLRTSYLFILARTKKSLQIRFGGVNPLSSEKFGQVRL